jgi:hypothetical protein
VPPRLSAGADGGGVGLEVGVWGIIPALRARSSMAEQLTLNQRVEGSSPSGLTTLSLTKLAISGLAMTTPQLLWQQRDSNGSADMGVWTSVSSTRIGPPNLVPAATEAGP